MKKIALKPETVKQNVPLEQIAEQRLRPEPKPIQGQLEKK